MVTEADAKAMFVELTEAIERFDEDKTIRNLILDISTKAGEFELLEEVGDPEYEDGTTLVNVDYKLKLGPYIVAEWYKSFGGYWGGGGTGWWIDQYDTDTPDWADELLELAEIDVNTPEVLPEPDDGDD